MKGINIKLIAEGYHPRREFSGKDELRRSIEKEGLREPITVRRDGEQYILIDGLRRLQVIKDLGREEVSCHVLEANEKEAAHLSWVKNTHEYRNNPNPMEEAGHLLAMRDKFGHSVKELVELGYAGHISTIYNKLSLLSLPDDVQAKIASGELASSVGYQLAKVDDEKKQIDLAEDKAAQEKGAFKKISRKVRELRQRPKSAVNIIDLTDYGTEGKRGESAPPPVPTLAGHDDIPVLTLAGHDDIPPLDRILLGDCLERLKELPDNSVDQVVTDPPYGMEFMGKDWDKAVPCVEIWQECFRVLKPGSLMTIMAASRLDLQIRMGTNLEKAGFRIGFSPIYWAYASGFPKASNIVKQAITKRGYRPEQVAHLEGAYGGFQPKPAVEPILVVMKPITNESYIDEALTTGKGITWLDGCRIPYADATDRDEVEKRFTGDKYNVGLTWSEPKRTGKTFNPEGRFPANLLVSDDILGDKSRYFSLDAWAKQNLPDLVKMDLPLLIVPKPGKKEKNQGLKPGEKNNHPTVKPVKLMTYLITMGSQPGDLVLDPFAGSGTICIAAKMLDRHFIGIELTEEYCEIAEKRVAAVGA